LKEDRPRSNIERRTPNIERKAEDDMNYGTNLTL